MAALMIIDDKPYMSSAFSDFGLKAEARE